jgi:phospholipase C
VNRLRTICGLTAAIMLLAGCSFESQPPSGISYQDRGPSFDATGGGKIKHIVYVIQEGRSFNTLFAGYPGAHTVLTGETSTSQSVALQPISLKTQYDVDHGADAMFAACNGTGNIPGTGCQMNGFNNEATYGAPKRLKYPQYVYVRHEDARPYWEMAHEWVLADYMFASNLDESFVAHQYAIAAQADRAVDIPTGEPCLPGVTIPTLTRRRQMGKMEPTCFDYQTLGGELNRAKLSWRYYEAASGGAYSAIDKFYHDAGYRKDVVQPPTQFLSDVSHGKLANFTWVTPTCADSDDASCGGGDGPSWVAAVVNAVGESKFWDSTAIVVQWDDWGGFYDDVGPRPLGVDGLGFRVPLLVISPYAKRDYVSHVHYETASVLRFAEDIFGLPQMAAADRRATSPAADCLDLSQSPRKFVPIRAPKDERFFIRQPRA